MNCKVVARATVNPTEDLDKIIETLSNVFNYADIVIGENSVTVTGDTSCLVPFKEFLENDLSPLGEIEVQISTENVEKFASWLCGQDKK